MKENLAKIKAALSHQGGVVPHYRYYLVKDRYIHAYDGRMTAAAPFPVDAFSEFLVPGEEFELLLDRLSDNPEITMDGLKLRLKSGRLRGSINLLPVTEGLYVGPDLPWLPPPQNLLAALKLVRPFIGTNAIHYWSICVSLGAESIFATTNISLVEVECPGLNGRESLLPCWAVDYLLSRMEALDGWQIGDSYIAFRWDDGSWMRTQLVSGGFPGAGRDMITKMQMPTWEITNEWREAYTSVASMCEDLVEVHPTCIRGKRGEAIVEHEAISPSLSKWNPKFLNDVVACATHLQLDTWPQPAPFIGKGIRGIIVGRT